MSQPVTVRLPEPSWEELRQMARREHRSVSEVGARFINEGLRQSRFPYIEFRSFKRRLCGLRRTKLASERPNTELVTVDGNPASNKRIRPVC